MALDFRKYLLVNQNQADIIFPMVYDKTGKTILWDGSVDSSHQVGPGSSESFDLNNISPPIPDQTIVILGCKVKGSGKEAKEAKDPKHPRTYVTSSQKTAVGTFSENELIVVDPGSATFLDAAAFQDAYFKLSNPAVAKLLVAVANVISPELV